MLQKSFWGDERKILEAIPFHPKSITDLRSGAEKPRAAEKRKD
jgi:hypothetical protein